MFTLSADNGIYILQTKDQYRVIETIAVENLWWDYEGLRTREDVVPTRLIEYYGDCKYTRDETTALKIAASMFRRTPMCEYGIKFIRCNKFWRNIVKEGKEHAAKELAYLQEHKRDDRWVYAISTLQNILAE